MSKVALFPGLDISQRQQSFRARVRVSPFYDLTKTFSTELDAAIWGTTALQRLNKLRAQLKSEQCLPSSPISRKDAINLQLFDAIEGVQGGETVAKPKIMVTIVRRFMNSSDIGVVNFRQAFYI